MFSAFLERAIIYAYGNIDYLWHATIRGMRIGIFADYTLPHIGGVETSIYHQHHALKAAGHQVFIISPPMRGAGKINDHIEDIVRVKSRPQLFYDGMGLYLYSKKLFAQLDELKLDVVHVESEFSFGSTAVRYARSRGLPCLYTAHTFYTLQIEVFMRFPRIMAITSRLAQMVYLRGANRKPRFKPVDELYDIPCHTWAQKQILRYWINFAASVDAVIGPSQRMVEYVRHYAPKNNYYLIPNPFAGPITDAHKVAKPVHRPLKIMTSAVMRPEKRPDVFITAISLLSPEQRSQIKVDMYGGGLWLDKMKKLVKKLDLQDTITLHGAVDNQVIQKALIDSDVSVSCSIGFDNQPMTILEAVHAGAAIMYCDKYLREGTNGGNSLLVGPNGQDFAKGISWLIANPDKIEKMKQASKKLSYELGYSAYVKRYEEILAGLK